MILRGQAIDRKPKKDHDRDSRTMTDMEGERNKDGNSEDKRKS